jgi:hypothetical protein
MFTTTTPASPVIGAIVGAGAYDHELPVDRDRAAPLIATLVDLRRARIDIYCDHVEQAVHALRSACTSLSTASSGWGDSTLAKLEEATWLTRHGQHERAETLIAEVEGRVAEHLA